MDISRIEHYRVMMLTAEITKFKEGFYGNDETPVVKSLDTFLTFLELLAQWDESAHPWQKAVLLAGCETSGKAAAYLINTMNRVERAELEDIFTVLEIENDRLRKEVQKAAIIDRDRIARIQELLDENKKLAEKVEGLQRTNDDLIQKAEEMEREHKRELEECRDTIDDLESENKDVDDRVTELEEKIADLENDLDDVTSERDDYRRDLRLTSDELDEVKQQLSRYE